MVVLLFLVLFMAGEAQVKSPAYAPTSSVHGGYQPPQTVRSRPSPALFESNIYADTSLAGGLMLYLPFNGNLVDSSGNGNDGDATAQAFTADPKGNPNSAYLFDGLFNYITIHHDSTLDPASQLTIAMWVRIDFVTNNYPLLLSKGAPQEAGFSNREYLVTWKDNFDCPYFQMYSAGDVSGQHELIESECHPIGQWVFFTGVIDRQNHLMQLYINGVLKQQVSDFYSSFNLSTRPLLVGWTEEVAADYGKFKGAMDELRLYRRALSASEILALYRLDSPTGVSPQDPSKDLPGKFALSQNYPNPFNPITTVSYTIGRASHVTLRVFDILGRTLATLVDESKPPGEYSVAWNATNMASGIYFYRLSAGEYTDVKRLLLVK